MYWVEVEVGSDGADGALPHGVADDRFRLAGRHRHRLGSGVGPGVRSHRRCRRRCRVYRWWSRAVRADREDQLGSVGCRAVLAGGEVQRVAGVGVEPHRDRPGPVDSGEGAATVWWLRRRSRDRGAPVRSAGRLDVSAARPAWLVRDRERHHRWAVRSRRSSRAARDRLPRGERRHANRQVGRRPRATCSSSLDVGPQPVTGPGRCARRRSAAPSRRPQPPPPPSSRHPCRR